MLLLFLWQSSAMEILKTIVIIISAIVLFIHGLQNFSNEIQLAGADKLRAWIGKITKTRLGGFLLGGIATALIQSSSAVSSITVSLVDSGVITFMQSLTILLGTNVGTTATAWIVTLKSNLIGPAFIVAGTLISIVPSRISTIGKSIFYFGFIFFSLDLISDAIAPLRGNPELVNVLKQAGNPFLGVFYGMVITILVQSSSVVSGLAIVLISQGILTLDAAIPIIIGANIGTTSTALIASLKLSSTAKLTALANFVFNFSGVVLVFPFIGLLKKAALFLSDTPAIQVAYAHLIFNLVVAVFFLLLLKPIARLLTMHKWYKPTEQVG
jgi:phosphate:Na+ symporter